VFIFRDCSRCRGDIYLDRDIYGDYKKCMQCGLMQYIENRDRAKILKSATVNNRKTDVA
jgi:acetyl-CoA carboxylase beta subunit